MSFRAGGILTAGLAGLLLLAPMPFGSVEPAWSTTLVTICLALGVVWLGWRARRGLPVIPWREPLFIASALFMAVVALQLLPVPAPALQVLSPRAAEFRAELEPAADGEPHGLAGRRPVSLYPWATSQALLRFACYALIALMTVDLAAIRLNRMILTGVLVAGGTFQAAYGLGEYLSGRQQIFGYHKEHYVEMATGTFINKNHYAGYLEMILPLALALAVSLFPRVRPSEHVPLMNRVAELPGRDLFRAVLALLLAILMGTAIAASQSKAGIACAAAAVLMTGAVLALREWRPGFILAAGAAVTATVLIFTQGRGALLFDRFANVHDNFTGVVGRLPIWKQAMGVFSAFPLTGSGLGTFQHVFPAFRTRDSGVFLSHAHNDYLELLAEAGTLGFVAFALGSLYLVWTLARRSGGRGGFGPFGVAAAAGVLAMALHSLIDFNLAIPANALTMAVMVGMLVAWRRAASIAALEEALPADSWAVRAAAPALALVAVALLAVAPVVAGGSGGDEGADGEGRDALQAAGSDLPPGLIGRWARAVDDGNAERLFLEAADLGRLGSQALERLNRIALDQGSAPEAGIAGARELFVQAIELQEAGIRRAPTIPQGHLYRGHLQAALCATGAVNGGDASRCAIEAMVSFRAAMRLNPMSATMHAKIARFYMRTWLLLDATARSEALPIIEKASAMNGSDSEIQEWISAARQPLPGADS
jgi:O-antigen ligase